MSIHIEFVKSEKTTTMQVIRARQALLPTGWVDDVAVGVSDDGRIAYVDVADSKTESIDTECATSDTQSVADELISSDRIRERNVQCVSVLLPAPVNVHSHAFQRAMAGLTEMRGPDPGDTFWTWRRLMYRFLDRLTPEHVESIAAFVQMEMLEAGYATNVEFHYLHHQPGGAAYDNLAELSERIVAAADMTGVGLTLLPVHYQFGGCDRRPLTDGQRRFGTDLDTFARLWIAASESVAQLPEDACMGVAPHSLRAIAPDSLSSLLQLAPDAPFHMHLAEQLAEVTEVEQMLGARPVEWLLEHADVDTSWCLIHCTQMLDHEVTSLAKSGAVAGLCPITESNLGDGIFEGVSYLGAGGRIAIGSDSNVRISLSEELRTLDYSQRLRDNSRAALATSTYSTGRRLFDAVVAGGSQAAGRASGSIAAGQWADLMALDGEHPDLHGRTGDTVIDSFVFAGDDAMVQDVWSAGRHQVTQGRHKARDVIVERYRAAVRDLTDF